MSNVWKSEDKAEKSGQPVDVLIVVFTFAGSWAKFLLKMGKFWTNIYFPKIIGSKRLMNRTRDVRLGMWML